MQPEVANLEVCIDRLTRRLPADAHTRLAALRAKRWPAHQRVLHIRFLEGNASQQKMVMELAQQWTQHAGIDFRFDNSAGAPIRIAFMPGPSWSYIGTDVLDRTLDQHAPTVNFGWLTAETPPAKARRVVLHEFGHVLGLIHEHQSPAAEIPWNREAVYAYFSGPPNFWSKEEVEENFFQRYDVTETNFSAFDSASIMLYPIPGAFTTTGFHVDWNHTLSETDRTFIGSLYPP